MGIIPLSTSCISQPTKHQLNLMTNMNLALAGIPYVAELTPKYKNPVQSEICSISSKRTNGRSNLEFFSFSYFLSNNNFREKHSKPWKFHCKSFTQV
uniref:Uncharacterized protein n=1 Tax=Nelumbo nucifera TaxID=4432 RepID=A0A822ZDH5_NELNU|nr:TPA_asm: hypothetical protein HUJ06_001402 [Nelumbo nucifera]